MKMTDTDFKNVKIQPIRLELFDCSMQHFTAEFNGVKVNGYFELEV